jgi:NOL1/NOP2/fmu family ribosome biogenesis protein
VKNDKALSFYKHKQTLYAMPIHTYDLFLQLQAALHIRKAGVCLGEWMHNGLQPDHALAMSSLMHPDIGKVGLILEDAQQYLRKENIVINDARKGWLLANFENIPLGWMKHLGNRTNNYYPKEWRLRK